MSTSILVPTHNMSSHLVPLAESLLAAGLLPQLEEILIVDDGSTDRTPEILERLSRDPRFEGKLRVLRLEPNRGRFLARLEGAKAARGEWLLFLDSRLQVPGGFALNLVRALKRGAATVGWIDIDVAKNIFCLYWQRSHEWLFAEHYKIAQPLPLTIENYDRYLKGTGLFLCKAKDFRQVCATLEPHGVRSDDTLLLRELLECGPIYIDPQLKVNWEPRAKLGEFLMRLFERGPGFVEYHVFARPGKWAVAVMIGLFALSLWLGFALRNPLGAGSVILAAVPLVALSAWPMGKTWWESLRLMPLHVGVVLFFGLGVLYGLAVNMHESFTFRPSTRP